MEELNVRLSMYVLGTLATLLAAIVIGVTTIYVTQSRVVMGNVVTITQVAIVIDREYMQHHSAAYTIMVGKVPVRFPARSWERWDEVTRREFTDSREAIREYTACHDLPNPVVGDRCSDIETTYDYLIRLEDGSEIVYRSQLFAEVGDTVEVQISLFSGRVENITLHK